nr:5-formyltetrahydrofolate cyclo-ligase [Streptomyces coelicoflavus]
MDRAKQAVRAQVWDALTTADTVHDASVHGRIPSFKGAGQAAARLAALPAWQRATLVKAVPDKAQLPVRARALEEGKTVYTAVPKLATLKPFYLTIICPNPHRPPGVDWSALTAEKITAIPALAARAGA